MNAMNESNKEVQKLVFEVLSERQRHRQRTDLKNLYRAVKRNEPSLDEDAFMDVFKGLDKAGAGSLIIGRRGNPNRFIWKYNLKAIAEAAQAGGIKASSFQELGNKPVETKPIVKRAKRRAKAVKMKAQDRVAVTIQKPASKPMAAKQGTFLQIDLSTMSPADVAALIALVSPVVKK